MTPASPSGISVTRQTTKVPYKRGLRGLLRDLDQFRGCYFSSGYEYPGRYSRWDFGTVKPPLELIAAGRQFTRRRAFIRLSASASGTIVGLTENRERDEISYFPKVKFQTASGREITFQSQMGSSSEAGRIGQSVAVRYRTDQPDVAEIDSFMSLWGLALLFGVLGVVFLFVGFGILFGLLPI